MICVLFVYLRRLFPHGLQIVSIALVIDYTHDSVYFEVLQAKVKCHLSVGPARPVPCALNKQNSARPGPVIVSSMYIT